MFVDHVPMTINLKGKFRSVCAVLLFLSRSKLKWKMRVTLYSSPIHQSLFLQSIHELRPDTGPHGLAGLLHLLHILHILRQFAAQSFWKSKCQDTPQKWGAPHNQHGSLLPYFREIKSNVWSSKSSYPSHHGTSTNSCVSISSCKLCLCIPYHTL